MQYIAMEKSFYAGFAAALELNFDVARNQNTSDDAKAAMVKGLVEELNAYILRHEEKITCSDG